MREGFACSARLWRVGLRSRAAVREGFACSARLWRVGLRRNHALGQGHEGGFEVDFVFLEERELVAGVDEQGGQIAVVLHAFASA